MSSNQRNKRKRNKKNFNSKNDVKLLTKDQFVKLGCDSTAFIEVALETYRKMHSENYHPGSTGGISLMTAALTNFGLGIELRLKHLYYKIFNNFPKSIKTHGLVDLYDKFERDTRDELEKVYSNSFDALGDAIESDSIQIFLAFTRSMDEPDPLKI